MSDSDPGSRRAWLAEALKLALKAEAEDEVPVGAVVIHQGTVVGRGYNRRERANDPLAHAELLAIHEASASLQSWRLEGCTLFVTLEPCPMCLAACQQARIAAVYYGAKDPKGGALSLGYSLHQDPRTHHRFEAHFVEEPACGKVLTEFFSNKRKASRKS